MICEKCGTHFDGRFCSQCGHDSGVVLSENSAPAHESSVVAGGNHRLKSRRVMIGIIVAAVIAVIVILAAISRLSGGINLIGHSRELIVGDWEMYAAKFNGGYLDEDDIRESGVHDLHLTAETDGSFDLLLDTTHHYGNWIRIDATEYGYDEDDYIYQLSGLDAIAVVSTEDNDLISIILDEDMIIFLIR